MAAQVSKEHKSHAIDTFVTAGIAFYLGGNWRGVFAKCNIPEYRRWKNKEKAEMESALNRFFQQEEMIGK